MTREIALHCMKSASELERELCEECPIYEQTGCDHCYEDALQYVIATLEQEPRWISVSERLPEKAFGCLVTVEEDDIYGELHRVIYPDFVGYDGETWNDADGNVIPFDVIAWMPLPAPFEPQKSEDT